jgi:fatty-acyl-CoA synthase
MAFKKIKPATSAYSFQLLINELLCFPLNFSADQEIVYRGLIRYTYALFGKRIAQLANLLAELGVKPGDTVAMMDWDTHRYLECYFAVPMMGAVLHTVNIRLSPEQLVYTINHAEDDVVLVNSEFLPMLEAVKDQFETDKKIILLNDSAEVPDTRLELQGEYEDLLDRSSADFDFPDFDENTVATVFYTTGRTGRPKGVYFTHRQLVLHTLGLISELSGYKSQFTVNSDDVYMPMTPMFHVHAWGLPYMMTALGTKQVYPGRYETDFLLNLVDKEKVTFSHCVPTILHDLLRAPLVEEVNVKGWKMIIGGSALSQSLCKSAMEKGINLVTGYGLSETCPVMTLAVLKPDVMKRPMDDQIEYRCRTGLPTPFVHVEVIDPFGDPLPHDGLSVGEVVVRSPWLTQGYLKDTELSEKLWKGGWLRTGDIGYFTEEGYLQITDRIKDVIKTGGDWLSSMEIEDIINQHEAVSEAAVIGVPDEKYGEKPVALVVLKEEYRGNINESDLMDFFALSAEKGRIPEYAIPHKIVLVDAIAKTSVGKLNKRNMREQLKL